MPLNAIVETPILHTAQECEQWRRKLERPTRRTYAFRHGKLVEVTDERKTPTFYGRIKCDPNWTQGFKG